MIPITTRAPSWATLWRGGEKLRFLVIGVWNTVFAYVAFAIVYLMLHAYLHYLLVSTLAHLLSVSNAFFTQRRWVFRSDVAWWPAFLRFNLVQLVVLVWSLAGLAAMVEIFHVQPLMSQIVVMAMSVIVGYLGSRNFSFRKNVSKQ